MNEQNSLKNMKSPPFLLFCEKLLIVHNKNNKEKYIFENRFI